MSVNNTSPTISVPVSIPINPAFSLNDVSAVLSTGSTKPPLQSQVVYQPISKVSINPMPAPTNSTPMGVQDNSSVKQTASTAPVSTGSTPVAPKQVITRLPNQITQPQKTFGKHQLPVRSVPALVSVLPHVIPRSTSAVNTVSTALLDPGGGGGGFPAKGVALQPASLPAAKQKFQAQHVLMAPGLRTPAPIKYSQFQPTTFGSVSFQLPNQHQTTTTLAVKPLQTGNRVQQPLVVRSIVPQPQGRPSIPLTVATTQEAPRRPSSVLHQPTTTISISVAARPNSQQEPIQLINATSRVSVTSAAGGKSVYQVSIASTSGVSPISAAAPKLARKVVTPRPATIVANNIINRTAPTSSASSSIATSVTSFTYSAPQSRLASIASITTSAVAKVFPQPPSVSGISAHVRTTEINQPATLVRHTQPSTVTANQPSSSGSSVIASVGASSRTVSSVMQPMIYMPQAPGISLSFPYHTPTATSYTSIGHGIRPALNISAPNQSAPIRLGSNLLVMEAPRPGTAQSNITAFTQGQKILQTVPATQTGGSDQPRMLPPNMASGQVPTGIQHVPNMSPKPAILRRPIRSDTSITKKLNFSSEPRVHDRASPIKTEQRLHSANSSDGGPNAYGSAKRYPHETTYSVTSNIKPALAGQVKPTVTSNGLGHSLKLQNSNTNIPFVKTEPGSMQQGHVTNSSVDEQKIGMEQSIQNVPFSIKTETVSGQRFQPTTTYHLQGNKQGQDGISAPHQVIHQPVSKVRQLQQRVTVTATPKIIPANQLQHGVNSPALPNNMQIRQVNSNTAMHYRAGELHQTSIHSESKLKLSDSAPAGTLKRGYDKITTIPLPRDDRLRSNLEQQNSHFIQNSAHVNLSNSAHEPLMGLSPRKKPRKQTHVVAEELPENMQMIDDEMSTDDADECEDEQPPPTTVCNTQENSKTGTSKGQNHLLSDLSSKPVVTTAVKPTTEYTDEDGVRYVVVRERPPINLLNGHRTRAVNNHFTHYSDVKVKEKKITFQDQCFDLNRMKGWKVKHLAIQLDELRTLDANALERIERVKNGLLQHCQTVLSTDVSPCEIGCKSPAQIISLPTSVATTTPTQARSFPTTFSKTFSSDKIGENSPLTPLERRASRIREEILKTEEMAQANIQRCNVMQEQLSELKAIFVKVLDNRDLATKLVEAGRVCQKSSKTVGSNGVRSSKKKKS
uniref:Histone deacetylase complex subunit SAP130 n=1 Tax=Phallusia mammillata TaxID=59560 RepID=A0A6F9DSA9_9ASCI|nr:histone deacetylase complex subunit SAP130 [Phallusia mammillata]